MTRVLFLYGGFPGHYPYDVAAWAMPIMDDLGLDVETTQDPHTLERDLRPYDLLVFGWTQSQTTEGLSDRAEASLVEAVQAGTGVAGWHGMTASFRASLPYHFITGSAFIEHPGGDAVDVPYDVTIVDRSHPVTEGVDDFEVQSEQYYMHVDPNVHVLASTTFTGEHLPWLNGRTMPVAYTHQFGDGRVFYSAPGHLPKDLENPPVQRLVRQGLAWAARS